MTPTTKHVELLVSSLGASDAFERQERYIDRLDALTATGELDSYTVTVWGDGFKTHSRSAHTAPGRFAIHRLLLLRQWCARNDAALEPLYDAEATDDSASPHWTVDVAPVVCCEFTGSRLQFATPYEDETQRISIDDHLDTLAPVAEHRLVQRTDAVAIEDPARTGEQNAPRGGDSTRSQAVHLSQ